MAQDVRVGRLGSGGPEGATAAARAGAVVRDAPDQLWRLLTSMRFALVLILAIAVLALIGTLLVQAPTGVLDDADAKKDWLNQVRPKYGGWTGILDTLGFFGMFRSIWFEGLVAFLTASLIACTAHRVPGVIQTSHRPRISVGPRFFEHAPQHERIAVRGDQATITETARRVLRKHGFRSLVEDDGVVHIYSDKWRFTPYAGLIGHIALVVIFAGVMAGALWGFRDNNFVIAEGSTATVPTNDGLSVKLVSFQDAWYTDTGAPADYASELVLYRDGQEVDRKTIRVNDPLRYGTLSFYQSNYGPAANVSVADATGASLFSDGIPLAWQIEDGHRIGTFSIPSKDLTVWVLGTLGSDDPQIQPGQVGIEVYSATTGAAIASKTVDQRVPTEIAGLTFTFDRELQYTGLSVARDPGTILVWLGSLLLVGGFTIRMYMPFRRIWGRLEMRPDGRGTLALASPGVQDVGTDAAFTKLVIDMRQAFDAPAGA